MTWTKFFVYVSLLVISCLLLSVFVDARYLKYRQTDPMDIVTKDKIDRDIDAWIEKLDQQTQADTITLTSGADPDIIQLPRKYKDANYLVFIQAREHSAYTFGAIPYTDSSFRVLKSLATTELIQWMTIYK